MDQSESRRRELARATHSPRAEEPESRADRLQRIRQMIDDGTYDTEERFEAACARMFGHVFE